ncbi:two-component sensor histidine kinase [Caulobacter ginsengisoli]|uniref:histidine kinase n=1 Tax=Caulobacter ginsengisoli TaxID=400775 RepID=A0ABU0IQI7_9CAUL|nr:HWE histidine kinase domain-containing protein [Caulobacter ginsengisoli]MDQ0463606.1 two-component sensor histidine kinase [Caulobacter ginsengisoli]
MTGLAGGTTDPVSSLDTLVSAIEALASARQVEDVAAVVRSAARHLSGADGVTIVLRDGDQCHYLDEDAIGPLWKGLKFPMSACISGWAMLNRQTVVIEDIYLDDRIPHDAYRPTFVRSLVMTPVRPEEPIAAIGAYWSEVRRPSDEEIANLALIARATATALANVTLLGSLESALAVRNALVRELNHRVKNNLAASLAIANQTMGRASTPAAFNQAFSGRIMALSRIHELLGEHDWQKADLGLVARAAVAGLGEGLEGRVSFEGPPIRLASETAVSMMMALHELADNAVRHGALGPSGGQAALTWRIEDERLVLDWRELDGPPVPNLRTPGFGQRLIERGLPRDVGGKASLDFHPEGFRYSLDCPLSHRIALAGAI